MTQALYQSYYTSLPTLSTHQPQFFKLQDLLNKINQDSPIDTNYGKNQLEEVCQRSRGEAKCEEKLGVLMIDDRVIQGTLFAFCVNESQVMLMISTLAAGFLIGENGTSVNTCSSTYNVSITSWSSQVSVANAEQNLGVRIFSVSGQQQSIELVVEFFVNVINRYKELTEGRYQDQVVAKTQCINGINFEYKPPPIHIMPLSARTIEFLDMKPSIYGKIKQERQKRLQEQGSQVSTKKQFPMNAGFNKLNSYSLPLYSPQKSETYSSKPMMPSVCRSTTTPNMYTPYNYGYIFMPFPPQSYISPSTSPVPLAQPIYHAYPSSYPIISGTGAFVPIQAQVFDSMLPKQR